MVGMYCKDINISAQPFNSKSEKMQTYADPQQEGQQENGGDHVLFLYLVKYFRLNVHTFISSC